MLWFLFVFVLFVRFFRWGFLVCFWFFVLWGFLLLPFFGGEGGAVRGWLTKKKILLLVTRIDFMT